LHSVSLFTGFTFDTSPSTFESPVSRGVLGAEMKGGVYSGASSLPAFKIFNQPITYFLSHSIDKITCIDSKVVVVEYDKTEDVHELICIDVWVPWIGHVTGSRIWLVILSAESCMPTYGKCQIMAIPCNRGKSKFEFRMDDNDRKNSHISEEGVGHHSYYVGCVTICGYL
jgi:hypothetical protein